MDKQLCWVTPLPPRLIPSSDELVREDSDVTGLAAALALLRIRSISVDRVPEAVYPDIRVPVRVIAGRLTDDSLAFAVSPCRGYDDGGGLEEDAMVGGLEEDVRPFGE